MITYFNKVKPVNFPEYYIDRSNLSLKKNIKQLHQDYSNYKKNKMGLTFIYLTC